MTSVIVPPAPAAEPLGRKREIEFLSQLVTAVAAGEKRAAVLLGPAGVGKTTLLKHCGLLCAREHVAAVAVRAPATAGLPPLFPIGEVVAGLLRSCRQRELEPPELLLRMEEALRVSGDGPAFPIALPQLAEAFEQVGSKTPIAILFDDYHWAPREGSSLLLATLRVIETPALFVATARLRREGEQGTTPLPEPTADLWIDHLQLPGLDAAATAELVARELGGPILPSLATTVYDHTVGNPLFVVEMLRRWRENGVVRPVGEHWTTVADAHAARGTLQEMVAGRLTGLHEKARRAASVLALFGRDVSFEELRAVTRMQTARLLDVVNRLLSSGVVTEEGHPPKYRLAHPIYAPSLISNLGPTGQAALHLEIYDGLRELSSRSVPIAELAHHAVRALEPPPDLRQLIMRAASEADRVGSYQEAAGWYDHLARRSQEDPIGLVDALERQATALTHFDPTQAIEVFSRAVESVAEPVKRARLLRGRAQAYRFIGNLDDALQDLNEALPHAASNERYEIRRWIAVNYGIRGRLEEAESILNDLALEHTTRYRSATLVDLGMVAYSRGRLQEAMEKWEQAYELGESYPTRIRAIHNLVWAYLLTGRWDRAREILKSTIDEATRLGDAWNLFSLLTDAARLKSWEGAYAEALDYCLRAKRLASKLQNPVCEIECQDALGVVYLESDRVSDAVVAFSAAVKLIRTSPETREPSFTFAHLAEGIYRLGDWKSATKLLEEARTFLVHSPIWAVSVERVEALCLAASGRPTSALEHLYGLAERASILPYEHAKILIALADVHLLVRDRSAARGTLEAALTLLRQIGAHQLGKSAQSRMDALETRGRGRPHVRRRADLTPREIEILKHVIVGRTNLEAARALYISDRTVAKHIENIMAKTGCRRRAELVTFAFREGLTGTGFSTFEGPEINT